MVSKNKFRVCVCLLHPCNKAAGNDGLCKECDNKCEPERKLMGDRIIRKWCKGYYEK